MTNSRTNPRHVPERTCIGCGATKDKRQLIRLVRTQDSTIEVDSTARKQGRGAYVCPSIECWERVLKGTRLEHALRAKVTSENRAALLQYIRKCQEFSLNEKTPSA
ncbi:MAG: YlxR family protein [Dehalococcoidia bacterium]|nr:YlxR family protein [Dehalococcoidia bacterium]